MLMPRRLISFDWALKRLLRSKAHFGILEGFLSELLQDDIQILEVLDSESGRDTPIEKLNRVDLRARNQHGEIILIEVQYERQFDYLQRILHSSARTVVDNLPKGAPYEDIVKVISVSILYFDFGQGEDYVYHGATRFIGLHRQDELQLSDKQRELYQCDQAHQLFPEYYLIKVNQFDDVARDPLDQWVYFLKNEEIQSDFTARGLQQAKDELDVLKLPEPERRAYERYQDDLHQQASMVQSSYGVGRMQGLKEGRRMERERIAQSLLDVITDDAILAAKTGLSLDDIRRLRGTQ
ncbi:MAG: hypothetical protein C1943_17240 [Halochromatium sp.]|nr:hypothetical protein [Halochromatium sp.]